MAQNGDDDDDGGKSAAGALNKALNEAGKSLPSWPFGPGKKEIEKETEENKKEIDNDN